MLEKLTNPVLLCAFFAGPTRLTPQSKKAQKIAPKPLAFCGSHKAVAPNEKSPKNEQIPLCFARFQSKKPKTKKAQKMSSFARKDKYT